MHGYGENAKMAEGYGGLFLENRAPELVETAQACFHHPCTILHKTIFQMDAWFSSYGRNKFCSMCFFLPRHFAVLWHGMKNELGL